MNHVHHMRKSPKGFSLVELLVVIAIIAGLAAMSYGPIMKQIQEGKKLEAINSGKNIHTALLSYAKDNDGLFPSEDTARNSEDGSSAEGCFTMLINSGKIEDEKIFWNVQNNVTGATKAAQPDLNGEVESGENAWGYVSGLSSSSRTNVPLIFDSSVSVGEFDTAVWNGLAIIVKADGSASAMRINYGDGKPLNDDGSSKTGPIEETRGGTDVDLFSDTNLPNGAEVLVPSGS
ncbi:type II secretion system protein [Rubritalea spongiae]